MASASHKGHETKSVRHLRRGGQASSENKYHSFKCDQETGPLIHPWQWPDWERSWLFPVYSTQHEWGHYRFLCVAGRITSVRTQTDGVVWIFKGAPFCIFGCLHFSSVIWEIQMRVTFDLSLGILWSEPTDLVRKEKYWTAQWHKPEGTGLPG